MKELKHGTFKINIKNDYVLCTNGLIGFMFQKTDHKIYDGRHLIFEYENKRELEIFLNGYLTARKYFLNEGEYKWKNPNLSPS